MRRPRRHSLLLVVGIAALAAPTSASAATQIGQTFAPPNGTDGVFILQSGSPGGHYTVPSGGVITSWSFQAPGSLLNPLKLKVARPAGGDSFTIVGEAGPETFALGILNTFPARIAVQAGDVIGLYAPAPGTFYFTETPPPGYTGHRIDADPPPGTTPSLIPTGPIQVDVSATLEPDCDGDEFGDETQDSSISSCHPRGLTLDSSKNKVKRGKKVKLTGQLTQLAGQAECQSDQPVELQRKKLWQPDFTTVEQLQTDAAGSFSAKDKVKKNYQYRAQAPQTATCAGQTSNTEKVKVKKPK